MKSSLMALTVIILLVSTLNGQHYMGGEITWNCVQSGNIRITLTIYDICANTAQWGNTMTLNSNMPIGSVLLTKTSEVDISPTCNADTTLAHIACPNSQGIGVYGIKKLIYTSDQNFPGGVPLPDPIPSNGAELYWETCCRTLSDNGPNFPNYDLHLCSKIYPPPGSNGGTCADNSPRFLENPPMHIRSSTPYSRMVSAIDPDGDSLVYDWGPLYQLSNYWIPTYHTGYSYSSPLPGPSVNPLNSPVVLDSKTGLLTLNSETQGQFFVNQRVKSYRQGVLIAEVNREMNVRIAAAGSTNNPPLLGSLPQAVFTNFYTDTLFAGDTAKFAVTATDFEFLPNNQPQSLRIDVTGLQLGLNGTNPSTGCLKPPCATLNPPPGSSSNFVITTDLTWPVTVAHSAPSMIGGQSIYSNQYDFIFRVKDDYCPIPGEASVLYRVVVFDTVSMGAPYPECTQVLGSNMSMQWDSLIDPYHRVTRARVMMADSLGGPYVPSDTLNSIFDNFWMGPLPNASQKTYFFYIEYLVKAKSGYYSLSSDTISTLRLWVDTPVTDGIARLRWNRPYHSRDDGSTLSYLVKRSVAGQNWFPITYTSQPSYDDPVGNQGPWYYMVIAGNGMIGDSSTCDFQSNVATYFNNVGFDQSVPVKIVFPTVIACGSQGNGIIKPLTSEGRNIDAWSMTLIDVLGRTITLNEGESWTLCNNPSLSPGIYLYEIKYILDGKEDVVRGKVLLRR